MNYKFVQNSYAFVPNSYAFISATAGKPLEVAVTDHINDGWVPAGGPFYKPDVNTHAAGTWCQAMWKPLDKEERDGRNL